MPWSSAHSCFFFFNDTATTEIYTLSLHDALPIWRSRVDLDRAGERPHRVVVVSLADVQLRQVVHRPHVTLVEYDRPLVGGDRARRVAQLTLHTAQQTDRLARRGVDDERRFDVR